jgi:hypothetical protein
VHLRRLDGHLSDVTYDARVCNNFRQTDDNFVLVRDVNFVSLLCLLRKLEWSAVAINGADQQ